LGREVRIRLKGVGGRELTNPSLAPYYYSAMLDEWVEKKNAIEGKNGSSAGTENLLDRPTGLRRGLKGGNGERRNGDLQWAR